MRSVTAAEASACRLCSIHGLPGTAPAPRSRACRTRRTEKNHPAVPSPPMSTAPPYPSPHRRRRLHRLAHLAGAAGRRAARDRPGRLLQQLARGARRLEACRPAARVRTRRRLRHRRRWSLFAAERIDAWCISPPSRRSAKQRQAARVLPPPTTSAGWSPGADHAAPRLPPPRVQLRRDGLRTAGDAAHHRRRAAVGHQPYGATKLMGENILRDLGAPNRLGPSRCCATSNPVGAHESGLIGEGRRRAALNNLMPYVSRVAVGQRDKLRVGSARLRHARRHRRARLHPRARPGRRPRRSAVQRLFGENGSFTVNLGTGRGYSVLEVIRAFERASGRAVPYEIVPPPPGDVAPATPTRRWRSAAARLAAQRGLDACADSWRWQSMNPNGSTLRRPRASTRERARCRVG